jgi:hypothetical protein
MDKLELIKKDLEKNPGYNFDNWNKGDLQMLEEIVIATENVVKNLTILDVVGRSEQLPPDSITDKEHKKLMKVLYPKDNSKRFKR